MQVCREVIAPRGLDRIFLLSSDPFALVAGLVLNEHNLAGFLLKSMEFIEFFYQQPGHFINSIPTTHEGLFCYDLVLNHDRV